MFDIWMVYFRVEKRRGNTTIVVKKAMEKKFGNVAKKSAQAIKEMTKF